MGRTRGAFKISRALPQQHIFFQAATEVAALPLPRYLLKVHRCSANGRVLLRVLPRRAAHVDDVRIVRVRTVKTFAESTSKIIGAAPFDPPPKS